MEDDFKKIVNGRKTSKNLKMEDNLKIFEKGKWKCFIIPHSAHAMLYLGVNFWIDKKQTKKTHDFETFHVVRSNRNNKIWTLKTNILMVLTLL